jgi:hypothetical protein
MSMKSVQLSRSGLESSAPVIVLQSLQTILLIS